MRVGRGTPWTDDDLERIEARVGYRFVDRDLLRRALTHSSTGLAANDDLAGLGDRIHAVWVARHAYRRGATAHELTELLKLVARREWQDRRLVALELIGEVYVGRSVLFGRDGVSTDMASTAFEAVVAAIELDGGEVEAVRFLERVSLVPTTEQGG